jgi:hypothetical protein
MNPEGATFPRPQEKLDGLIGGLAFDPLAFMTLKPREQREELLRLSGVDLDEIEARREEAYQARRQVGRELRSAEARLEATPKAAKGAPREELSVASIARELADAIAQQRANDQQRAHAARVSRSAEEAGNEHGRAVAEAAEKEAVAALAERLAGVAEAEAEALVDPDIEGAEVRVREAEAINTEVRKGAARRFAAADVSDTSKKLNDQQEVLDAVAAEKAEALDAAELPVEGLKVTEDGIDFDGIPLDQASMSQRVKVCTAISAALNQELKIALVRSGNDLDAESLEAFYGACRDAGVQAWVERIEGIGEDALVIEAGRVANLGPAEG